MLRHLCCERAIFYWGTQCRFVGASGCGAAVCSLCRTMGWCVFPSCSVIRYFHQLVYTARYTNSLHSVGANRVEFRRTMGLRSKYRSVTNRLDHLSCVLDMAMGTGWSGTIYSADRMFG